MYIFVSWYMIALLAVLCVVRSLWILVYINGYVNQTEKGYGKYVEATTTPPKSIKSPMSPKGRNIDITIIRDAYIYSSHTI